MTQHQVSAAPSGIAPSIPQRLPVEQPPSSLPYYPQQAYPLAPYQRPSSVPYTNRYLELGKLGALVGLCGAGAANLRRLEADQVTRGEALFDTLRTGVAAGLATATAGFVADQFRSPAISLLATLATGTAMMYIQSTEKTGRAALPGAPAGE